MTYEVAFMLVLMVIAVVAFVRELFPIEVTALGVLAVLILAGILEVEEALAGFSSSAAVAIGSLFVLSHALTKAGLLETIVGRVAPGPASPRAAECEYHTPTGRGGVEHGENTRPSSFLFPSDPCSARSADRRRRDSAQAHGTYMAPSSQGRGLCMGPSRTDRKETQNTRASSRNAASRWQRGPGYVYNVKELRDRERKIGEQAELAYQRLVANWRQRRRKGTGAAKEARH